MAIAIGHGQISPSPATLTPLFELENTSVDNEVLVKKSPHLLLGLNLSSRSPQVDPTESFDVWTVALQDGPDVHTALAYAMHAPEQRYHLFEHSSKDVIWLNNEHLQFASISLYLGGPENLQGKSPP